MSNSTILMSDGASKAAYALKRGVEYLVEGLVDAIAHIPGSDLQVITGNGEGQPLPPATDSPGFADPNEFGRSPDPEQVPPTERPKPNPDADQIATDFDATASAAVAAVSAANEDPEVRRKRLHEWAEMFPAKGNDPKRIYRALISICENDPTCPLAEALHDAGLDNYANPDGVVSSQRVIDAVRGTKKKPKRPRAKVTQSIRRRGKKVTITNKIEKSI